MDEWERAGPRLRLLVWGLKACLDEGRRGPVELFFWIREDEDGVRGPRLETAAAMSAGARLSPEEKTTVELGVEGMWCPVISEASAMLDLIRAVI